VNQIYLDSARLLTRVAPLVLIPSECSWAAVRAAFPVGLACEDRRDFILSFGVSNGYTAAMTKDSGLRIRVQRDLRDRFLEVCRAQDKPAAQVLREFMRAYVERQEGAQGGPAETYKRRRRGLTHEH
jgi:hypothetical protein